jgi:hypothetical protein
MSVIQTFTMESVVSAIVFLNSGRVLAAGVSVWFSLTLVVVVTITLVVIVLNFRSSAGSTMQ